MKGKCKSCARYNPKALAHCRMSDSVFNLEKRYGFNIYVSKCPEYLAIVEVFPESKSWEAKDVIDDSVEEVIYNEDYVMCDCEDYNKYGICECEGD